jgi:hypothetical protein
VRDQVSHTHQRRVKLCIYVLIFKFLERWREDKRLNRMVASVLRI